MKRERAAGQPHTVERKRRRVTSYRVWLTRQRSVWRNARAGTHHGSSEAVRTSRRLTSATNTHPRLASYLSNLFKDGPLPPTLASRMAAFTGGTRKWHLQAAHAGSTNVEARTTHEIKQPPSSPSPPSHAAVAQLTSSTRKQHQHTVRTTHAIRRPPPPPPSLPRAPPPAHLTHLRYFTISIPYMQPDPTYTAERYMSEAPRALKRLQHSHKLRHSIPHTCKSRGVV